LPNYHRNYALVAGFRPKQLSHSAAGAVDSTNSLPPAVAAPGCLRPYLGWERTGHLFGTGV